MVVSFKKKETSFEEACEACSEWIDLECDGTWEAQEAQETETDEGGAR